MCVSDVETQCAFVDQQNAAIQIFIGFEAEFFIFENVQYSVQSHRVGFSVDCKEEAYWNSDGQTSHF